MMDDALVQVVDGWYPVAYGTGGVISTIWFVVRCSVTSTTSSSEEIVFRPPFCCEMFFQLLFLLSPYFDACDCCPLNNVIYYIINLIYYIFGLLLMFCS